MLIAVLMQVGWIAGLVTAAAVSPALPPNLATQAVASADSVYSDNYLPRFAVDGRIPAAGSHADLDQAWCVRGETHREGAAFSLAWPAPVTIAEVVYYARTAWYLEEGWRDYRLYLDGAEQPVRTGRLDRVHGPQRLTLPAPQRAQRLRLVFAGSYGGPNPGATEIMVFPSIPPEGRLPEERRIPRASAELAAQLKAGRLGFTELLVVQRRPIESTHVYTYHVEGFRAGGGLYAFRPDTGALRRLVDAGEGQILDADLAYNGTNVLFSWRQRADAGYHLFTVGADGTGLRQLTDGRWHDYNACWLPDGGIAFLSTRSAQFAYCWISPVGLLHRMEADGSLVRRLSANIVNDFTPSVLNDGRIIYSRWEYVDKPAIPIQSLWAINPDGTGLTGYFGNRVLSPATFMEARAIPGSTCVLCTLTAHNGPASGAVGLIDRAYGMNAQAAIRNLTPEVDIGRVEQGSGNHVRGPYAGPYPLAPPYYLVSRGGTILLRDYDATQEVEVLAPRDGVGFHNPQPLAPRPLPPTVIPSALPAPTGTVGWATVFLQDVYRGLAPHVPRGAVAEIAVVQEMAKPVRADLNRRAFGFQFPVISCGATYAGKLVWGYAPVAEDGSACFRVPAGVPLYFMALDAQGRAVQRMRTFTHFMPGEQQGCLGCHESRQGVALAGRPRAPRQPVCELRPPDWGQGIGFDYAAVVQPVLDRHCVRCHQSPNRVDLGGDKTDFFNVSYETLARGRRRIGEGEWDSPYVSWIPTYNGMEANILEITPGAWGSPRSKLADIVVGGHPDAAGRPRVQLAAAERRRVLQWIDLNVPYYGTSETAYPGTTGCRRLYPAELDATLRAVAQRRCAECHAGGAVPREVWTRITNPGLNRFLLAPLAKAAGGTEACGRAVFADTSDPDYQALLRTFEPVTAQLQARPRDDMPGARPDQTVCRDAQ